MGSDQIPAKPDGNLTRLNLERGRLIGLRFCRLCTVLIDQLPQSVSHPPHLLDAPLCQRRLVFVGVDVAAGSLQIEAGRCETLLDHRTSGADEIGAVLVIVGSEHHGMTRIMQQHGQRRTIGRSKRNTVNCAINRLGRLSLGIAPLHRHAAIGQIAPPIMGKIGFAVTDCQRDRRQLTGGLVDNLLASPRRPADHIVLGPSLDSSDGALCVWLAVTKRWSMPELALMSVRNCASKGSSGVRPRSKATIATDVSPDLSTSALAMSGSSVPVAPCVRLL